ncbi:SRPBCC family protein [Streptomyces sp. NPDC059740]|uniref:SRPBCC family protein n=1 Tax=Streptomyces sp. NPDC059740 TaxID=3346926 RepID=UPI003658F69D
MALFTVEHVTPLGAPAAWERLTDWPRHGDRVPLTRVSRRGAGPTGAGTVVLARTGVGRLGFDDPMEVVHWSPPAGGGPGRCRLVKRGRVVHGWAEFEVVPLAVGARAVWREEVSVRGLPAWCEAAVAPVGRLLFGGVLRHLLRG